MIQAFTATLLAATSVLLFAFGLNLLYLTWCASRLAPRRPVRQVSGDEPAVCIQVPVYNERYVVDRVLDAVCSIDWPRDRLEVQVLDDSDDTTPALVAARIDRWRRAGVDAHHVRRGSRDGYKAGALAHGLALTAAPFVAIFDADFVPPPDFMRRTIGAFDDPSVGFVQARWGHLDEGYSWFTRLQALAIDFHFLVEQSVRSAAGYFTNFTGTAGVWRRAAIEDAGGWSSRTLTEDLDLSYRAQLRGWKAAYVEDLVVPEELPVSIDAYRRQQSRWATGSFQSAFNLLGPVLGSRVRPAVKVQAAAHLLAYGVGPVMLVQLVCYPLLLVAFGTRGLHLPGFIWITSLVAMFVGTAPWIGFIVAQSRRGRRWWAGLPAMLCQVVGAGMSLNTLGALARATRPGGSFVRTPKYRIERHDEEWRDRDYVKVGDPRALLEAAAGMAALALVPAAIAMNQVLVAVYAGMFATGFLAVAALSAADLLEVFTLRRLGREALGRLRAVTPAALLLALAAGLLTLATQIPEPFEDAYGHWLIAANLASTGHLRDPIFGMEDSWLPGYHVLAGAVLQIVGLGRLDLLKALSALFGLVTLALVYALAPSVRQGRLAIALLALNPVFLFTSGSAVVEPMLTALLTGAALSAVRGRLRLASLLAALACLTSTKAWLWVAVAAGFAAVELLRVAAGSQVTGLGRLLNRQTGALVWTAPAIAVVAVLQLGFSPASHSAARGTVEVLSATARGSIAGSAPARLGELAATLGLGAIPLFGFGILGAAIAMRRQPVAMWRYLYAPAFIYLAVVLALVAEGTYTGSHRYLYPALPALALLAAAALDRYAGVVRIGAVAASALLAIAFFPVFVGFAAQNAGLVAAGRAASAAPGTLITDSPAVAFFSGKAPNDISGSQALPAGRAAAIQWMAKHGVTELVLEDISYYRAAAVFPELVTGRPDRDFTPLGLEAWYRVPGGKPVYAYRFGAAGSTQVVVPGIDVSLGSSTGAGKTATLARGLSLGTAAGNLAGEGMGFGAPIVHYPDGWVYARTATTQDLSTGNTTVWRRTFELNEMGGDAAHGYAFVAVASRGEIAVTYTVDAGSVTVAVSPVWLAPRYTQVGILNEQSASFDDLATSGQVTLVDSRFGRWEPVAGSWARLRSAGARVEWSVAQIPTASLFAGRELAPPGFDWAGLDYMFGPDFGGTTYRINVQEAR